jgi:hypothetical protein
MTKVLPPEWNSKDGRRAVAGANGTAGFSRANRHGVDGILEEEGIFRSIRLKAEQGRGTL